MGVGEQSVKLSGILKRIFAQAPKIENPVETQKDRKNAELARAMLLVLEWPTDRTNTGTIGPVDMLNTDIIVRWDAE